MRGRHVTKWRVSLRRFAGFRHVPVPPWCSSPGMQHLQAAAHPDRPRGGCLPSRRGVPAPLDLYPGFPAAEEGRFIPETDPLSRTSHNAASRRLFPPAVCSVVAPLIPGSGVLFPPPASPSTFTVHLTDLPRRLGGCGAPEDARRHSMRRACRRRGHGSRAVPAFSSVRTS